MAAGRIGDEVGSKKLILGVGEETRLVMFRHLPTNWAGSVDRQDRGGCVDWQEGALPMKLREGLTNN